MGNLPLFLSLSRTDAALSPQVSGGKFAAQRIRNGITYYYSPFSMAGDQTVCLAKECQPSTDLCPTSPPTKCSSADPSSSVLLSGSQSQTSASYQNQSDSVFTSRPLLVLFSWLGAQPGAVAKYRDLYLDHDMDVLLVQSSVMHFLWPRWGLDYGLQILKLLQEPPFSKRPVLVHASSIGGYTFTQVLTHIAQGPKTHADLAQRVIGHIYDSLVVGSLEHMAIGLGRTLMPRLEVFIKHTTLLYFWLFKSHTADFYNTSIQVFHNNPITSPALFFFSENDALCDPVVMEQMIDLWRKRGVAVQSRKWKESIHAAHMRCHPQDYLSSLEKFLMSLSVSSFRAEM
ncbi:Transmembrane protein 53 [Channa argus]|uniref:Transmembrane protein 53 n=1 Tax=Channa argus TaxID=215402 RepID=A0A6G1QS57_CHAAH|nr:Transmembrane protein 53 [Channa argus]KAK2883029.1 hypothetical protein Q8A73_021962 [Channa argus]